MFVKIGNATDVADGPDARFDVDGTKVNVANASGHLYAFDDTCTHMGCSLAQRRTRWNDGDLRLPRQPVRRDLGRGPSRTGSAARPSRERLQVEGDELLIET